MRDNKPISYVYVASSLLIIHRSGRVGKARWGKGGRPTCRRSEIVPDAVRCWTMCLGKQRPGQHEKIWGLGIICKPLSYANSRMHLNLVIVCSMVFLDEDKRGQI